MSEGKSNVPCEVFIVFFFNDTATTEIYTLSLTRRSSDLADIDRMTLMIVFNGKAEDYVKFIPTMEKNIETYISGLMENGRSEEHTSELQSRQYLVCRLLLEKKKKTN